MKKAKQIIAYLMAFILVLGICGCTSDNPVVTPGHSGTEDSTFPSEATTEAPADQTTEPTEATTESTEPSVETEPTETIPLETTPQETVPQETEPEETLPQETDPTETEPVQTEPEETEPAETEHIHSYTSKVIAPTCTEKGYTEHTCSCGDSYRDSETAAKGHDYEDEVVEPTTTSKGYTLHTCKNCEGSYKDNYTEELPDHNHNHSSEVVEATCTEGGYTLYTCSDCGASYKGDETDALGHDLEETFVVIDSSDMAYTLYSCTRCEYHYSDDYISYTISAKEIQDAIIKYINQYRANEGKPALTYLPGMTQVAVYRSVQLTTNFAHDTSDEREAYAYYQYGRYVDATEYGGDTSQSYWTADAGEAIGYGATGNSADEIGKAFALGFLNSIGHWRCIGNPERLYIGVGCTKSDGKWYCCVIVGTVNYG